jgi:hypothetical protein
LTITLPFRGDDSRQSGQSQPQLYAPRVTVPLIALTASNAAFSAALSAFHVFHQFQSHVPLAYNAAPVKTANLFLHKKSTGPPRFSRDRFSCVFSGRGYNGCQYSGSRIFAGLRSTYKDVGKGVRMINSRGTFLNSSEYEMSISKPSAGTRLAIPNGGKRGGGVNECGTRARFGGFRHFFVCSWFLT